MLKCVNKTTDICIKFEQQQNEMKIFLTALQAVGGGWFGGAVVRRSGGAVSVSLPRQVTFSVLKFFTILFNKYFT